MSDWIVRADDVDEWQTGDPEIWGALRWKEMISQKTVGADAFVFGQAELPPGGEFPLHRQPQAETLWFLSGIAQLRLGARRVEVEPNSAAYFPAGAPHAIRAVGPEPLVYLYTYATEKLGQEIEPQPVTENEANQVDIMNLPNTRWAVREDFEPWVNCEPSKGDGLRVRFLFDEERGEHPEMQVGIGAIGPDIHYTLHYHAMPEIYYVLGGDGLITLDDDEVEVSQDDVLYLPANIVHGADNFGEVPLRLYYIYGLEGVGLLNWQSTWTPVEDIYTRPRPRRNVQRG